MLTNTGETALYGPTLSLLPDVATWWLCQWQKTMGPPCRWQCATERRDDEIRWRRCMRLWHKWQIGKKQSLYLLASALHGLSIDTILDVPSCNLAFLADDFSLATLSLAIFSKAAFSLANLTTLSAVSLAIFSVTIFSAAAFSEATFSFFSLAMFFWQLSV